MLISERMNSAVNQQIGKELEASHQYIAIASYFATESLPELATKFYSQADEERDHAMRFVKFLLDAGAKVEIPAVAAPKCTFGNTEEAIQLSLESEKAVTRQISDLVQLAVKESDYITHTFLDWFMKEQLEEVSAMETLLGMVRRAGEERLLHVEAYLARKNGKLNAGEPERMAES